MKKYTHTHTHTHTHTYIYIYIYIYINRRVTFYAVEFKFLLLFEDRLLGVMYRVPGYRFGGPGFDSRALQEKKSIGSGTGPLSLVSTTEELLGSNNSGSGLESREYGRRDSSR
jgi:hypothetical protein